MSRREIRNYDTGGKLIETIISAPKGGLPVRLEHVVCGECQPTTTLCGTPLTAIEKIVPPRTDFEFPPCVVCFGSDTLTYTNCGEEIQCL